MKINKKVILAVLLVLILTGLYTYNLVYSFNYDNDFGRDIYDMLGIVQGHLRLLGPRLSFGGFISGPYYYYLFAIPLFFGQNPASLLYFSVLVYIFGLGILFWFFAKKGEILSAFLFTMWVGTSSYFIFSVRNPGNAFSYFWLLILFAVLFLKKTIFPASPARTDPASRVSPCYSLGLGVLAGMIANFHFVNLIIFSAFWLCWFVLIPKDRNKTLYFLAGLMLSFLPQILFELRHGFVMIKNTFVAKSYENFTERVLPTALPVSKNPISNFFLIAGYINNWMQGSFLTTFSLLLYFSIKNLKQMSDKERVLVGTGFLAFIVLLFLARFQFVFHYFLPFLLMFQISLFLVVKRKRTKFILFLLLLIVNLLFFPKSFYTQSTRKLSDFESFSHQLIADKVVLPIDKYNIFIVRETPYAIAGWEYRFFLKKYKADPLSSFDYNISQKLLVIAEPGQKIDLTNLHTWEFGEFGEYTVEREGKIGERSLILLGKKY